MKRAILWTASACLLGIMALAVAGAWGLEARFLANLAELYPGLENVFSESDTAALPSWKLNIIAYLTELAGSPLLILLALGLTWFLYKPERKLLQRFPILSWNWPKAIGWKFNLNTFFFAIPALRMPGMVLMFMLLPIIVTVEEIIFRLGTDNWMDGSIRSALFGLTHFAIGMTLGAMLYAALAGFILTFLYFNWGINSAIMLHFAIDVLLLVPVMALIIFGQFIPERILSAEKKKQIVDSVFGIS